MQTFKYYRPADVEDAVKAFNTAEDPTYISGGMTLLPTMKQGLAAPEEIIDLSSLKNSGVAVAGATVTIQAGTTHYDVSINEDLNGAIPGLARLASEIGDPAVRNRGTLGGSIANNDPAADYPAACLALGATIHTDRRDVPAEEFFEGAYATALDLGEIIKAVSFPVPEKSAYAKFRHPASRYAVVGVYVARLKDGTVRVAVTGGGNGVFRASDIETALGADFGIAALDGAEVPLDEMNGDMHFTAAHRARLVPVLAKRAVENAA